MIINRGFLIVILLSLFWVCFIIFLGFPALGVNLFKWTSFTETLRCVKVQELNANMLQKKMYILIVIALVDFAIRAIISIRTNKSDTILLGQAIFVIGLFIIAFIAQAINENISNTIIWPYLILFFILLLMKITTLATYLEINTIRRSNIT